MRSFDDSANLSPESRLSEAAGILAAGILRLHARNAISAGNFGQKNLEKSVPAGLEVSEKTVLSVLRG
jgi:hypothetical protein